MAKSHLIYRLIFGFTILLSSVSSFRLSADTPPPKAEDKGPKVAPSYAWTVIEPLGLHDPSTIDTLFTNYGQQAIASGVSDAWATTGNFGAPGKNMIFTGQLPIGNFFLADAMRNWIPSASKMKFYNTRIPMTLVSYNTGGDDETTQDRLRATFSGNISKQAQVGADFDYLYSKGSYNYQALKHLNWGISGSYIGDRYEFQGFYNHYNLLNKENGGITDILYITDPAVVQGGDSNIDPKAIPTNLTDAHNRILGEELWINNRYKVGFWQTLPQDKDNPADTIVRKIYVPVTSFIWTMRYNRDRHMFLARDKKEIKDFFENTYLDAEYTRTDTKWWNLSNTFGISLLEGFNKYAKFGLSAYATYQIMNFNQTPDNPERNTPDSGLTPFPEGIENIAPKATEHLVWVGGQLTKQKGSLLTYQATAQFGLSGRAAGDIEIEGQADSRFALWSDTLRVGAFVNFENKSAPYLMDNYLSNHFIWKNDFDKSRMVKLGGSLAWDKTNTRLDVTVANLQNTLYFNEATLPTQHSGNIQVICATLKQNFQVGIFNWQNTLTYQTSSNQDVMPLPKLAVYSNLFILCRIATLHLQFGVDCNYYTSYYAPAYQPATMTYYNQHKEKLGNFPFCNLYANMKLSKTRFYVMWSHFNQALFNGKKYFSTPGYPLNPARLLLGVSVDFAN